jgi:hypothetical protein
MIWTAGVASPATWADVGPPGERAIGRRHIGPVCGQPRIRWRFALTEVCVVGLISLLPLFFFDFGQRAQILAGERVASQARGIDLAKSHGCSPSWGMTRTQADGAALSRCVSCLGVRGSWCGALSAHSRVAQRSDQRALMIARRGQFGKNKRRTFVGYEAPGGIGAASG